MNDFIESSLKKLKNRNIPNPILDLRILLKYSSAAKKEIFLSNLNLNQINKNMNGRTYCIVFIGPSIVCIWEFALLIKIVETVIRIVNKLI